MPARHHPLPKAPDNLVRVRSATPPQAVAALNANQNALRSLTVAWCWTPVFRSRNAAAPVLTRPAQRHQSDPSSTSLGCHPSVFDRQHDAAAGATRDDDTRTPEKYGNDPTISRASHPPRALRTCSATAVGDSAASLQAGTWGTATDLQRAIGVPLRRASKGHSGPLGTAKLAENQAHTHRFEQFPS